MYKRSKTTIVIMIALVWLFLICLMSQATAEVTASIRTDEGKYFLGEEISTWITIHVSQDVITDADFFQKKFERQLDVRNPNKDKIIPTYYETNPGQNEPPPPPPDIPKIVLKAGDYDVVLEDLAEHYAISEIGPYTVQFVTSITIYESNPKAVEIASILKEWIQSGKFLLTEPVAPLPSVESGVAFKPLKERPIVEG